MYSFGKYLNIPFKDGGRDFTGVDCYGLVHLIYRTEKNIVLPDYTELSSYCATSRKLMENHILTNFSKCWKKISDINYQLLDGLLFSDSSRISSHIGLYIGNNKFLHVVENGLVEIGKLDIWQVRLTMAVRYADNA